MKVLLSVIFFVIPSLLLSSHERVTLRALLVTDTFAEETEKATVVDLEHMKKSLAALAHHLHAGLDVRVVKGSACSIRSIKKALFSLKEYTKDIVIFYYSGHGDKDPVGSLWPVLYPSCERDWTGLLGSSVVSFFQEHRHRFTMLLFESCNTSVCSGPYESVPKWRSLRITTDKSLPGLKRLFLKSRGLLIACGASHGEYGTCFDETGSVFTNGFFRSLNELCVKRGVSWAEIFSRTTCYCRDHGSKKFPQHPIFQCVR